MNEANKIEDIIKSMIANEVEDYVAKYMVNYDFDIDNTNNVVNDQGWKLNKLKSQLDTQLELSKSLLKRTKTLDSDMADYEDQREDMDTLISNQAVAVAKLKYANTEAGDVIRGLIGRVVKLETEIADGSKLAEDILRRIGNLERSSIPITLTSITPSNSTFKKGEIVMVRTGSQNQWLSGAFTKTVDNGQSVSGDAYVMMSGSIYRECRKLNATERGE